MLVKNPDISNEEKLLLIQDFDTVLALDLLASAKELTEKKEDENTISSELLAEVEKRIKERDEAKKEKDYARADAIRNELLANGIMLIDSPEGTSWKKQN
jgi:cysteinyl-tRNA synthetase